MARQGFINSMFRSPESDFLIKKVKEKNRECARTL
jgi:hypothetical protein